MEQTEQDAGKPKLKRSFQHFFCCFLAQVDKSDRMCLQKIASDLNEANIADLIERIPKRSHRKKGRQSSRHVWR